MIVAELKDLSSTDVPSLETYNPVGEFGILVFAMVGPAGDRGQESFQITVCTPDWFLQHMNKSIASGRHHLFVRRFNYQELWSYLADYCSGCTGSSWQEAAEKVARIGFWEFEDYKP
ncbi:immunity 8 family protein [Bradyrhizobium liaoningense]